MPVLSKKYHKLCSTAINCQLYLRSNYISSLLSLFPLVKNQASSNSVASTSCHTDAWLTTLVNSEACAATTKAPKICGAAFTILSPAGGDLNFITLLSGDVLSLPRLSCSPRAKRDYRLRPARVTFHLTFVKCIS